MKMIECVPNFSEGRDQAVIEAICKAILSAGDCEVWDYSADPDHNRSVFTIAGSPESIENAALRFTRKAAELIDMQTHTGVHPCIGATDVIPLIPLKNADMTECIELAEKTGRRIASELNLPVYLYAQAARTPAHRRLADIRRGGYQKLKQEIAVVPDRAPDFGPEFLPAAGGVSVGARDFLIAFNVYLDSADPAPARQIAREIRESSGGFPALQAIGLPVNGLAQISMNFLDFRRTPLQKVVDCIQFKAEKLGISPLYSELIGMIPAEALSGTSPENLLLKDFSETRILETHFRE